MLNRIIRSGVPLALLITLLLLQATGCGRSNNLVLEDKLSAGEYVLTLVDSSGEPLQAQDAVRLQVSRAGGEVKVTAVLREDGLPLGADFYAELAYPKGMQSINFVPGPAFGDSSSYISLALLDRNPLPIGISLITQRRAEKVRAGELFTVRLKPGSISTRSASGPPRGSYNVLRLEDFIIQVNGQYVTFQWKEKNRGDYNRDGVVTIADITPIAMHFGITPAQNADIADLVDASGDGKVGVDDVTPIAMNFNGAIEGYRIWRSNLAAGDYLPNVDEPTEPQVSASRPSLTGAPDGRLAYSYQDYAPSDTVHYVFFPFGDGAAGIASDEIHPFSGDTTPPTWVSSVGIISAVAEDGPQIRFTFGEATDADSPPVRYRLYWQEGPGPVNLATARKKIFGVIDGEPVPYSRLLLAGDGVVEGQLYSLCIRAFDMSSNETTNTNYVLAGGSVTDFTPPVWTSSVGVTSAVAGDGQVTVGWGEATDADSPPVTYLLFYALVSDGIDWGTPQATFPAATRSTVVGSLVNGEQYVFGVLAQDSSANQNKTANTNTLTATPQAVGPSPFPFGLPPDGQQEVTAFPITDSAIVTDSDNCPAIVSVDKSGQGINFHYYDEAASQWVTVGIDSPNRFYHPAVLLVGDAIYAFAFDGPADELVLYTGSTDAQTWTRSLIDNGYTNCYELSATYDPDSQSFAVIAAMDPPSGNEEVVYFHKQVASAGWNKEIVDNTQPNIASVSIAKDPVGGQHCIAYANGIITEGSEPTLNVQLKLARRAAANNWNIETIYRDTKTVNAEMVELAFDPISGYPHIAMTYSRIVIFYTMEVPVTDAVVCRFDGTEWRWSTVETRDPELNGLDFYFYFAGADPQVSFAQGMSFGAFTYVLVEAIYRNGGESLEVYSSIKQSYFTNQWGFPLELTEKFEGASADSLAFSDGSAQISYAAIGVLDFGPTRNNYPQGNLTYYREL